MWDGTRGILCSWLCRSGVTRLTIPNHLVDQHDIILYDALSMGGTSGEMRVWFASHMAHTYSVHHLCVPVPL